MAAAEIAAAAAEIAAAGFAAAGTAVATAAATVAGRAAATEAAVAAAAVAARSAGVMAGGVARNARQRASDEHEGHVGHVTRTSEGGVGSAQAGGRLPAKGPSAAKGGGSGWRWSSVEGWTPAPAQGTPAVGDVGTGSGSGRGHPMARVDLPEPGVGAREGTGPRRPAPGGWSVRNLTGADFFATHRDASGGRREVSGRSRAYGRTRGEGRTHPEGIFPKSRPGRRR